MDTMSKPIVFLLIFFSLTAMCMVIVMPAKASSKTITVPDDYPTIRAAIGNATAGDTIFVRKGLYNQTINVDKSLSLIGEDNQQTVIIGPYFGGTNTPPAVSIEADNVFVSGFNITQSWNGIIVAENCTGCKITGNNIEQNFDNGILCKGQAEIWGNNITNNQYCGVQAMANSIIVGNNITGTGAGYPSGDSNYRGDGIRVYESNITVQNNVVSNNLAGIVLSTGSGPFNIFGNNITSNRDVGIEFTGTPSNVTVHHNNIKLNNMGVILDYAAYTNVTAPGSGNVVYNNNFYNWQNVVVQHDFPYHVDFSGAQNPITGFGTDIVEWDNGKEGNHWVTYFPNSTEANSPTVTTAPYIIDDANADNHPLPNAVTIPEFPLWTAGLLVAVATTFTVLIAKKKQHKP
jgi:parallel beta-helix repeat protein